MKLPKHLLSKKIILLVSSGCFALAATVYAQQKPPSWVGQYVASTKTGVTNKLLTAYDSIVAKYDTRSERWWETFQTAISKNDRQRLREIFGAMSVEQQAKQKIAFIKAPQPLKQITPAVSQFNSWKNENVYGIWIDGKKVSNAILNNFTNSDFKQVTISKLYGAARKNKKYAYQVNLMTDACYQLYYNQTIANNQSKMVFRP